MVFFVFLCLVNSKDCLNKRFLVMKRLSILILAVVAFSISSYASGEYNVLWSLNNDKTFNAITDFVKTTPEQNSELRDIFYNSTERLKEALTNNDKVKAEKALDFNLANAKAILNAEQYRKYLQILNTTYYQQRQIFDTGNE